MTQPLRQYRLVSMLCLMTETIQDVLDRLSQEQRDMLQAYYRQQVFRDMGRKGVGASKRRDPEACRRAQRAGVAARKAKMQQNHETT